jgi:hypothetical protein
MNEEESFKRGFILGNLFNYMLLQKLDLEYYFIKNYENVNNQNWLESTFDELNSSKPSIEEIKIGIEILERMVSLTEVIK